MRATVALPALAATWVVLTFLLSAAPVVSAVSAGPPSSTSRQLAVEEHPFSPASHLEGPAPLSTPDAATWSLWNATNPSPAPFVGSMVYDAVDHEIVLFMGSTWTYANDTWTEVCSGTSSPPVCAQEPASGIELPMAYDAADGYVLLGDDGATWSFAHGLWVERTPQNDSFAAEYTGQGTMAYDPVTRSVILVGGDQFDDYQSWSYANGSWTAVPMNVTISPREGPVLFYDPVKREMVYFGGGLWYSARAPRGEWPVSNSEWVFANGSWSVAPAGTTPPGGIEAGFAWDSVGGYGVLLTGGYEGSGNQTWVYADGNWTNVTSQFGAPANEYYPAMTFDAESGYTLLIGGSPETSGYTVTNTSWILYHADLTATLRASTTSLQLGQRLAFDTIAAGGAGPYSVDFQGLPSGCADVATYGNFSCEPLASGTYAVSAEVTGLRGGTTSAGAVDITVINDPSAEAHASPDPTTVGVPVVFAVQYAAGIPAAPIGWSFGDGAGSPQPTAAHVFQKAGTYVAEFSARNLSGALLTVRVSVVVDDAPTVAGSLDRAVADVGMPVSFRATTSGGTGPVAVMWNFGDGSSSQAVAPAHVYSRPGPYQATVIARDRLGVWTVPREFNVTINPDPYVTISGVAPTPVAGAQIGFSAEGLGGTLPTTFLWNFGNGVYAEGPSPEYAFPHPGSYVVSVIFQDAVGGQSSGAVNVSVAAPAGPSTHEPTGTFVAPPSASPFVASTLADAGIIVAAALGVILLLRPPPPPTARRGRQSTRRGSTRVGERAVRPPLR